MRMRMRVRGGGGEIDMKEICMKLYNCWYFEKNQNYKVK